MLLRKGAKWKAGLASALVWGSGQLWNRQYVKAAFFFLMQVILIIALPSLQYGLWGLFTLGETEMIIQGSKVTQGDNSIILMILGIVWAMVAILFACIYYANIANIDCCPPNWEGLPCSSSAWQPFSNFIFACYPNRKMER